MVNRDLSKEEKRRLTNERQKAVRNAWKEERELVINGKGTRDWNKAQQKELIEKGAVCGFNGHHMKSVSLFPEYAGDSENIQFLTEEEHLHGAHKGDYHIKTNGYYNPFSKKMENFKGKSLQEVPVLELSEKLCDEEIELNAIRNEFENIYSTQIDNQHKNSYSKSQKMRM